MEDRIQNLEKEIEIIKARNLKVEGDKAWEMSNFRTFSLCLITFIISLFVFYIIGNNNVLFNAIVATLGYFLSTLYLPFIKKWWIKSNFKK